MISLFPFGPGPMSFFETIRIVEKTHEESSYLAYLFERSHVPGNFPPQRLVTEGMLRILIVVSSSVTEVPFIRSQIERRSYFVVHLWSFVCLPSQMQNGPARQLRRRAEPCECALKARLRARVQSEALSASPSKNEGEARGPCSGARRPPLRCG